MAVLLDTNILLRSAQTLHPQFSLTKSAVAALRRDGEEPVVAIQNLIEFWVVATRPERQNGLGMSVEKVTREIATLKNRFQILPEGNFILHAWERLVSSYKVSGKNAHDARLVAVMNLNRIEKILTFNTADFSRFREIQVLDPHLLR
jgi:predicted nucleic acid-binding protein